MNPFGASIGNSVAPGAGEGTRWPAPAWRFGLRSSDDRGNI